MKKLYYILIGACVGIGAVVVLAVKGNSASAKNEALPAIQTDTLTDLADDLNTIKYYAARVPDQVTFAGETVPMDDPEVYERLDRELNVTGYWHSNTIQNLKLANRWFPVIEKTLKENGVPDDFKFLAMAESGLSNVIYPSNAHGYCQFL